VISLASDETASFVGWRRWPQNKPARNPLKVEKIGKHFLGLWPVRQMFCCCRPTLLFVAPSTTQHFPSMRPFFSAFCAQNGRCCRFSSSFSPFYAKLPLCFSSSRQTAAQCCCVGSQQKHRGSLIFGRSVGDIQPAAHCQPLGSGEFPFHRVIFPDFGRPNETIPTGRPIVRKAHDLSTSKSLHWKTIRRLLFLEERCCATIASASG